ncbi:MAG: hypothetical protein WAR77_09175 [Saprospiraceae bacterium]|nr:hypothetical protein [Saprospiraceae bacterium]
MDINNVFMRTSILICFVLMMFVSCKTDGNKNSNSSPNSGKKVDLNAFPADKITEINKVCTSIDLISLKKDVNVSMSFDNPQSVAIILSFVTDDAGNLTNMCAPEAHLMFQNNGEIIQEMDLFYKNGCNALVFLDKEGKQIGANLISNEGVDFFQNFLKSKNSQDSLGRPK